MSDLHSRLPDRLRPAISAGLRLDGTIYAYLLVAFIGVGVTGAVWAVVTDILALEVEGFSHLMAQIHGGFAMVAIGVVGLLLGQHARLGWRARRNRISGSVVVGLAILLGGTAWGLYYGNEVWRFALVWTHIGVGLAGLTLLPLHIWLGRRPVA